MGNDEGGGPTGVAKVRSGAERSRRAAPRRAAPLRSAPRRTIATMSAAPMTHCLRINSRGMANSDEERGLPASLSFPFMRFLSAFPAFIAIYSLRDSKTILQLSFLFYVKT